MSFLCLKKSNKSSKITKSERERPTFAKKLTIESSLTLTRFGHFYDLQ